MNRAIEEHLLAQERERREQQRAEAAKLAGRSIDEIAREILRLDALRTQAPMAYVPGALKHYAATLDDAEDFGFSAQEMHWRDGHVVPAAANVQFVVEAWNNVARLAKAFHVVSDLLAALRALRIARATESGQANAETAMWAIFDKLDLEASELAVAAMKAAFGMEE